MAFCARRGAKVDGFLVGGPNEADPYPCSSFSLVSWGEAEDDGGKASRGVGEEQVHRKLDAVSHRRHLL